MIIETIKTIVNWFFSSIINYFESREEYFITEEGWETLDNPDKKIKLHKMIENYHKTGIWDFKILNDEKI